METGDGFLRRGPGGRADSFLFLRLSLSFFSLLFFLTRPFFLGDRDLSQDFEKHPSF